VPLKSKPEAGTKQKQPGTSCWTRVDFGSLEVAQGPPSSLFSMLRFLPRVTGPGWELALHSHLEIIICSTAVKAITTCFYKDLCPEVLKMTSAEDFHCVSIAYGGIKS